MPRTTRDATSTVINCAEFHPNAERTKKCGILNEPLCLIGSGQCPFRKTDDEKREGQKKAEARLEKMGIREYYADKYGSNRQTGKKPRAMKS